MRRHIGRLGMARQTGKISDKLGLSPKNPFFSIEKLGLSSDKLGLSRKTQFFK